MKTRNTVVRIIASANCFLRLWIFSMFFLHCRFRFRFCQLWGYQSRYIDDRPTFSVNPGKFFKFLNAKSCFLVHFGLTKWTSALVKNVPVRNIHCWFNGFYQRHAIINTPSEKILESQKLLAIETCWSGYSPEMNSILKLLGKIAALKRWTVTDNVARGICIAPPSAAHALEEFRDFVSVCQIELKKNSKRIYCENFTYYRVRAMNKSNLKLIYAKQKSHSSRNVILWSSSKLGLIVQHISPRYK
jgi:hypothetical protein